MIRKFDSLGRISIPKEMRDKIGIGEAKDEAKIELLRDKIVISNPNSFDLEEYIREQIEVFKDDNGAYNAYCDILRKIKEPN